MMPHKESNAVGIPCRASQPPANGFGHMRTLAFMAVKMKVSVAVSGLSGQLADIMQ